MAIDRNASVEAPHYSLISVSDGVAVVPTAAVLMGGSYGRSGADLTIDGPDGSHFVIPGYFSNGNSVRLTSPEGVSIDASIVEALTGPLAKGQYAQLSGPAGQEPIGQVVSTTGDVQIRRADGTLVAGNTGDFVFQDDVVTTGSGGKIAITFSDGSLFQLSADARMVLDQYVYNPGSSGGNQQVFNLLSGVISIVGGAIAPSGDMLVTTPIATLAIRGTSLVLKLSSTQLSINLITDLSDGQGGLIEIYDNATNALLQQLTVNEIGQVAVINAGSSIVDLAALSPADFAQLQATISSLATAYSAAVANPMQGDGTDAPTDNNGTDTPPDSNDGTDSGANENGQTPLIQIAESEGAPVTEGADEEINSNFDQTSNEQTTTGNSAPTSSGSLPPTAPVIVLPDTAPAVAEDGSVVLSSGFAISDPNGGLLTVAINAFSTVTLTNTEGLVSITGNGTDAVVAVGTGAALTNALNGLTYTATPDNDQTGGFAIAVTDGEFVTSQVFAIPLTPQPDAPEVAAGIAAQAVDEASAFSFTVPENVFFDPDTGDTIELSASRAGGQSLPGWLSFDGTTFSGTPAEIDIGDVDVVVTATDSTGLSVDTTFTVSVNNVEFPATIAGDSGTVSENDAGAGAQGRVIVNDADSDQVGVQEFTQDGSFGSFSISRAGEWTYAPDTENAQVNAMVDGESLTETFTVISLDGSAETTVSVSILGANDIAVLTASTGVVEEDGLSSSVSGEMQIADPDQGEAGVAAQAGVAGSYGTFSISEAGAWTYLLNNALTAVQELGGSDSLTNSFTVTSLDGTASNTVTVTVTGSNDPATVSASSGSIDEDGASLTGSVIVTDPDQNEAGVAEQTNAAGSYGTFSITEAGAWTYLLNNALTAVQELGSIDSLTDSFTVTSLDGTASNTVTVTINGANDIPTLTAMASAVTSVNEDSTAVITLDALKAQGDEADIDGAVDAFVVKAVNSGTLLIGGDIESATPWEAGSNDTIDAIHNAYWTGDMDANGLLGAFSVVARDDGGAESASPVLVEVDVISVDDPAEIIATGPWSLRISDPDGPADNFIAGSFEGSVLVDPGQAGTAITGDGTLVTGLGDATGDEIITDFGEILVPRNDDGFFERDISSVFEGGLNFFGTSYSSLFVNTNGNVSFGFGLSTFTPSSIAEGTSPLIAPFWADVDTRAGGPIYVDLDESQDIVTFTWANVGYYNQHATPANSFQLQLYDRGSGDFDIVFRYDDINWTTGDASGGSGGLGGTPARAGYSEGAGVAGEFAELLQSGTQEAILSLDEDAGNFDSATGVFSSLDNLSGSTGLYVFEVRNGVVGEPEPLGTFSINEVGDWSYSLNPGLSIIQELAAGSTLVDTADVSTTVNGLEEQLSVAITALADGTEGDDVFVLPADEATVSVINQFDPGADSVDISNLLDDAFAPAEINNYVRVSDSDGATVVEFDPDGTGPASFTDVAVLTGVTASSLNFVYDDAGNTVSVNPTGMG